jgi:hypothetical protein
MENRLYYKSMAIAKVLCDTSLSEKVMASKMEAILQLDGYVREYEKEGFMPQLTDRVYIKKLGYLTAAKTCSEIQAIMKPPKPYLYAGKVQCDARFHVPEEELMLWSITSLRAGGPLNPEGYQRYRDLFKQVFGCDVDEYLEERTESKNGISH